MQQHCPDLTREQWDEWPERLQHLTFYNKTLCQQNYTKILKKNPSVLSLRQLSDLVKDSVWHFPFFLYCFSMLLLSSQFWNHFLVFFFLLPPKIYLLFLPQHQPDDEPDKLSNRVFQFDPGKDRWTECSRMKYSRYRCGTAVVNGEIYILGQTTRQDATVSLRIDSIWEGTEPDDVCVFFRWYRMWWRRPRTITSLSELCGDL